MIQKKDINWYLEDPSRLLLKKPFTRGGTLKTRNPIKGKVGIGDKTTAELSNLDLDEVSQDIYLQEYNPYLHKILYNKSIPQIAVRVGNEDIVIDKISLTAAFQKNIHAAHVLHLTANQTKFNLCNLGNSEEDIKKFQEYKQQWVLRHMENVKYDAISKEKKCGDVGVLFVFDPKKKRGAVKVYSYDDGYCVIPNYDEFGEEISRSLYYKVDNQTTVIDTYDDTYHYRSIYKQNIEDSEEGNESGWLISKKTHGFSRNPLLYHRGMVAWEYAENIIEMWELLANINAVVLKRFGTWGLVLKGEMDESSFQRDNNTLIINLPADESSSKTDAKTLEFPEPQKMVDYLEFLIEQISIASSVSFITPKDITSTGSGGNGIALAMRNDIALATQSVAGWSEFMNDMVYLFQELLGLEEGSINKYVGLKINAKLTPWSMETNNTKVTNLAVQTWLSDQTKTEESPDAAPDEMERKAREQKELEAKEQRAAERAERISRNNNTEIIDDVNKTIDSGDVK